MPTCHHHPDQQLVGRACSCLDNESRPHWPPRQSQAASAVCLLLKRRMQLSHASGNSAHRGCPGIEVARKACQGPDLGGSSGRINACMHALYSIPPIHIFKSPSLCLNARPSHCRRLELRSLLTSHARVDGSPHT